MFKQDAVMQPLPIVKSQMILLARRVLLAVPAVHPDSGSPAMGILADRSEDRLTIVCEDLFNPREIRRTLRPSRRKPKPRSLRRTRLLARRSLAPADLPAKPCPPLQKPSTKKPEALTAQLQNGAIASGFAEHWHPQTAHPGRSHPPILDSPSCNRSLDQLPLYLLP